MKCLWHAQYKEAPEYFAIPYPALALCLVFDVVVIGLVWWLWRVLG